MLLKSVPGKHYEDGFLPVETYEDEIQEETDKEIRCAFCENKITDMSRRISINGAHEHIFANPHGLIFETGCFKKAEGCAIASPPSSEFTWFPGYMWRISVCSHCINHLGWFFSSENDSFFCLILKNLIFP